MQLASLFDNLLLNRTKQVHKHSMSMHHTDERCNSCVILIAAAESLAGTHSLHMT